MNKISLLNYFYAVSQEGSISKGAKRLGITQPTVTKMIKELEEIRGAILFNRHSKGISLTQEGEMLLEECEKIFSLTDNIFKVTPTSKRKVVKIGIEDFLLNAVCLKEIGELKKEMNDYELQFIVAPTDDMYFKLQASDLDFVISFYRPRVKKIHLEKLKVVKQILVSHAKISKAKDYSFIGQRQINTKQKRNLPTIKYLRDKGLRIKADVSSNSLQFAKAHTELSESISLLPMDMVREELKLGKLVHVLKDYSFASTLKLCYTDESPFKVLQLLKKYLS